MNNLQSPSLGEGFTKMHGFPHGAHEKEVFMADLRSFLNSHGFSDVEPILDEKFHECRDNGHKLWFIGSEMIKESGEKMITFTIADWRDGKKYHYRSNGVMSKADEKVFNKKIKELQQKAVQEKASKQLEAQKIANEDWATFIETTRHGEHPYLSRKKITQLFGAKINNKGNLVIPARDVDGTLWGYQTIYPDGAKYFISGQRVQSTFHLIGTISSSHTLYIVEGFATGCSTHMATGAPVAVAFYANNLCEVGDALRKKYPTLNIVVAGDDDKHGSSGNPGRTKATACGQEIRAKVVFPKFKNDSTKPTDFNDLHILEGLDAVKRQLEGDAMDAPIKTEKTGFHSEELIGKRFVKKPEYEDLRLFFEKKQIYKNLGASELCYIWTGTHYKEISDAHLKAFAQEHFDPTCTNNMAKEFVGIIHRTNMVDKDWFNDTTQKKINFKNGVLDIETGEFSSHSPDFGFRYVLEYDYNLEETCPNFDKMLNDVTCGDESLKQILLEFSGYCLSSDSCWAHKALILEGSGSNGKSTFMNCLRSLAGQANYTSLTLRDLQDERKCQLLDGKLFNLAEETPSKGLMDSSIFKNLVTGGETTVEQKYKNPYSMRNRTKMIFACNELPDTYDTTKGFFRRFIIVPFRAYFDPKSPTFDPFIEEKLVKERSGIFNRVFYAYHQLKNQGAFTESHAVQSAVQDYEKEINPIVEWCQDFLDIQPVGNGHDSISLPISEMHEAYSNYMRTLGYNPINIKLFGRKLRAVIPDLAARKFTSHDGSNAKKALKAVGWKPGVLIKPTTGRH